MSENRWEILEIGAEYTVDKETGKCIVKKPRISKLLRRKR